jgi:hypothetical protein
MYLSGRFWSYRGWEKMSGGYPVEQGSRFWTIRNYFCDCPSLQVMGVELAI